MGQITNKQQQELKQNGYTLLPNVLTPQQVETLCDHLEALWTAEGQSAGSENYIESTARRLANLANKGDIFRSIFAHPTILSGVEEVIGPNIRVSMLNARDALPHTKNRQPFHCDTDDSGTPDDQGYYACTVIWMLDDFTPENGATRLVPGTHLTHQAPKEVMDDVFAAHPDEVPATGKRGDVLVFNGHCWHAGGLNQTDQTRRAILVHYLRAGIPRRPDRRQHLDPEVRAQMPARELELLGLDEMP